MKRKFLFAAAAGLAALVLLTRALPWFDAPALAAQPLDLSAIDSVDVRGAAGRILVTANPAHPFEARLTSEHSGWGAWRSLWYDTACPHGPAQWVENGTARIDTGPATDLLGFDECLTTLTANVRPGATLRIDQQAAQIQLAGDYSLVDIKAAAGDVALTGHAERLSLSGAALRARLVFDTVRNSETIRLFGTMMEANLVFPVGTAISYVMEATASRIDSRLPNTQGAKPEIAIRGSMVHATIR